MTITEDAHNLHNLPLRITRESKRENPNKM